MANITSSGADPAKRPLSPHLQIYRWTITMALSILHRATGAALGAGTLLLAWWLVALASGPDQFDLAQACLGSLPGQIVLFGFSWALLFHLLNGIRHLAWDAGAGLELTAARVSGWVVVGLSLVGTAALWFVACSALGQFL